MITPKRVAIICEFSGTIRRAMRALGHDAWSFDLLPAEDNSPYHVQGDCLDNSYAGWDLVICHPPCTDLAVSGALHFERKRREDPECIVRAATFAITLWNLPVPQLALENPISLLSNWKKPTQIIQPWMFGHPEVKRTCLWLRGLPKLEPTLIVEGRTPRTHHESPGPDRWKRRSRTLPGVAAAMADQWGSYHID